MTSLTVRRWASDKAMPRLPASTVTQLSRMKQVRRCAAFALPSASNELGKSWIFKNQMNIGFRVEFRPPKYKLLSASTATDFILAGLAILSVAD